MKTPLRTLALAAAVLPLALGGCAGPAIPSAAPADHATAADHAAVAATAPAVAAAPQAAQAAAAVSHAKPLPPPTAAELQHGLQIAQLGVTASGGLVDVRFKVLDPVKVRGLLGNPAHAPMLLAGDQPPLMAPHHALRGAKFGAGQVFYILYPNLRGTVQPGVEVTVAVGDVRLGPVKAQ